MELKLNLSQQELQGHISNFSSFIYKAVQHEIELLKTTDIEPDLGYKLAEITQLYMMLESHYGTTIGDPDLCLIRMSLVDYSNALGEYIEKTKPSSYRKDGLLKLQEEINRLAGKYFGCGRNI